MPKTHLAACVTVAFVALVASVARAKVEPFDEQTLGRIQELNRAISDNYEDLQDASSDIEAQRDRTAVKIKKIEQEILEVERARADKVYGATREERKALEDQRLEIKSRYLEALAERHAIDVESTQAFEKHATAILINLENLAEELARSGRLADDAEPDSEVAEGLYSLQRGTAIALRVLEDWGALERDDPRFRSLWATARILSRNVDGMRQGAAAEGIQKIVELVQDRIFVVRSLVDQARALQPALDQKGLLLQVAAQNRMLQLYSSNIGLVDGLELPDLRLEESIQAILDDIEDVPGTESQSRSSGDPLDGLDACALDGVCN